MLPERGVQGYLAHKRQPPPLGPPKGFRHGTPRLATMARAARFAIHTMSRLLPAIQGQNPALTDLRVPYSPDSGRWGGVSSTLGAVSDTGPGVSNTRPGSVKGRRAWLPWRARQGLPLTQHVSGMFLMSEVPLPVTLGI